MSKYPFCDCEYCFDVRRYALLTAVVEACQKYNMAMIVIKEKGWGITSWPIVDSNRFLPMFEVLPNDVNGVGDSGFLEFRLNPPKGTECEFAAASDEEPGL